MKTWISALLAVSLLGACAHGGSPGGSITMYGTIDTGVTVRN